MITQRLVPLLLKNPKMKLMNALYSQANQFEVDVVFPISEILVL